MTIDPKKLKEQERVVATMKEQPPVASMKMEAAAPVPPSAPPKPPPLPRVPRSPRRTAVAAREAAAAAAQAPAPPARGRELPADPAAREAALAEVRPLAEMILALCDVLAVRLPPARPLSPGERQAIGMPLELTLYKYNAEIEPEWQLLAAIGSIIGMRYVEAKMPAQPAGEEKPAAKTTVEIQKVA